MKLLLFGELDEWLHAYHQRRLLSSVGSEHPDEPEAAPSTVLVQLLFVNFLFLQRRAALEDQLLLGLLVQRRDRQRAPSATYLLFFL